MLSNPYIFYIIPVRQQRQEVKDGACNSICDCDNELYLENYKAIQGEKCRIHKGFGVYLYNL